MLSSRVRAGIALAVLVLVSFMTWYITSSIKDAEIAKIHLAKAEEDKKAAVDTLNQFTESARIVNEAATKANLDVTAINKNLDLIYGRMKNAKPPKLPAGCAPDPIRVRGLKDSIEATNRAISGRGSGETLH